MIICKRCGWEIYMSGYGWRDKMGHYLCVKDQSHLPDKEKVLK